MDTTSYGGQAIRNFILPTAHKAVSSEHKGWCLLCRWVAAGTERIKCHLPHWWLRNHLLRPLQETADAHGIVHLTASVYIFNQAYNFCPICPFSLIAPIVVGVLCTSTVGELSAVQLLHVGVHRWHRNPLCQHGANAMSVAKPRNLPPQMERL